MSLKNRDLFVTDPTVSKIPNEGVARVGNPSTPEEWQVLEWELRSFVCDGEYEHGLERILESFLENLSQPTQPAAWISGFYGSGKSHLARVLEHLWRNVELPGGERARQLTRVSDRISDHLTELSTAGKRSGGLWSAAGTLAAGRSDAVRLAFLSVLYESAGLPGRYQLARFLLWAEREGYLDSIEAAIEADGRTLRDEVGNLHVSPFIHAALLEADPSVGSVEEVRAMLRSQFPPRQQDISDEEMFEAMRQLLETRFGNGEVPLTLIVLDEMQQYIGEDNDKALEVQNIIEGCTAQFGSKVLVVATGQSALTSTATLQKLTDRFPVQVALSDTDVETVVREVVLRKKPEYVEELTAGLETVSGEIDQHLGGTTLAPKAADRADLVADYPLLPTRRRFWEQVLRSIDNGRAGVLRTQLRIVHEAVVSVADEEIGHVIGADFIYREQSPGMLASGVLLKEIDELIARLAGENEDGRLKSRICSLVFLLSKIPTRTFGGDTGLRVTAPFIADLLVEDLGEDGPRLRAEAPQLLDSLVEAGTLMRVEDTYRLQTEEGAEWEKEYGRRLAALRDDPARLGQFRDERIEAEVGAALRGLHVYQGASKVRRDLEITIGPAEPEAGGGRIPVWIRDEWSVSAAAVKKSAAEAGADSPTVFVLLPKHDAEGVKEALASHAAAEETLRRPTPQTDEGKEAQKAMKTRRDAAKERLARLLGEAVAEARVYQGGGAETTSSTLRVGVEAAAERSAIRLFPKFRDGDHGDWDKVAQRARAGAPDALEAVDHHGNAVDNPVCKEVLAAIPASGIGGGAMRKALEAPPYGWNREAIAGATLVLLATGNIRADLDGRSIASAKDLLPTQVGKATFFKENEPPSTDQRFAIRGLLSSAEIDYKTGQENVVVNRLLQKLKDLAAEAGGPAPLPAPPSAEHIDALLALAGNEQLRAVAEAHSRLDENFAAWSLTGERRGPREMAWNEVGRLLRHADGLDVVAEVKPAIEAVKHGRQLLNDPDPLAHPTSRLTEALRAALSQSAGTLADANAKARTELEASEGWAELDPESHSEILSLARLESAAMPEMSSIADLLNALDATPLRSYDDPLDLVAARQERARRQIAKRLEPRSVDVRAPSATIKTEEDLDAYLDHLRKVIQAHLDDGDSVIL